MANIFRRQAKSLPSVSALRSIVVGLSKDDEGMVDTGKAKSLYERLMNAAGYDLKSDPFLPYTGKKRKLNKADMTMLIISNVKRLRYGGTIYRLNSPTEERKSFDAWFKPNNCPCLARWDFMFAFCSQNPYYYAGQFIYQLCTVPQEEKGKYSVVTNHKEIYETLAQLDFSYFRYRASVIMISEDGELEEIYIETAFPHDELDKNGLTF